MMFFVVVDILPSDLEALKEPSVFLFTLFNSSFPAAFAATQVAINQLLLILFFSFLFFVVLLSLLVKI